MINIKDKRLDFFENKLKDLNESQKVMRGLTGVNNQKILEGHVAFNCCFRDILMKLAAKIMAEMIRERNKPLQHSSLK